MKLYWGMGVFSRACHHLKKFPLTKWGVLFYGLEHPIKGKRRKKL